MRTGEVLDDKYEILERLGAGGMGEVYKASHRYLGTERVIKVIRPHVSGSADAQERFVREARAATKVHHQNVATLHDFSRLPDGSHYMVWEYIDGENLAQRLRMRGTLPPRQAVAIALQTLQGLEAIHRAGIVHRDISPENLMISRADDAVKIIDLGVAKLENSTSTAQTQTGIFIGKLRYASPEQLGFMPEGEKLDARTDLYAVAMVLVEMLTGRPPYEAKSPHEYFLIHAREPRQKTVDLPPELPGSAALQEILEKALARDRNRRFATAGEFAAALEEVARSLPDPGSEPTQAVALDAQTTMRVTPLPADTLHRSTVRTAAPAASTVRTPLPAPAAPTIAERARRPRTFLWIAAFAILAAAAMTAWMMSRREAPKPAPSVAVAREPASPAVPAQSTLTVRSDDGPQTSTVQEQPLAAASPTPAPTASAPPPDPADTVAAAPVAAVQESPAARRSAEREQAPEPRAAEPRPATATATATAETYVDGAGDEEVNERTVERLRQAVQGVRRVEIHAGAMQQELLEHFKDELSHLEVVESADVVIRFEGTLERLGRGRKKRSATATISRGGSVVFRYQLPELVYRVGMTPAEAFTNVISDAFVE